MKPPTLEGKRYIALARCSTAGQADTSIPDQLQLINTFANENQMIHVSDVELDGVTGSIPAARTDIDQIIQRKKTKNDFDTLLVQDTSRFTRGGIAHGSKLEWDLKSVGIQVIFVMDNIVNGDFADLHKAFLYMSGQQHAKSISMAASRGSMSSLLADRSAHCRLPPYGIDRLYIKEDGKPSHIIRNLPDGTQVKLDPETRAVLDRFGRNAGRGTPQHYIKQKNEKIVLIPGAPEAVGAINLIFRKYHLENWGFCRIAEELNAQGIPASRGKQWATGTIRLIIRNPIYLGVGVANRESTGIYSVRSPNQPLPSHIDASMLATDKMPTRKLRPRSEWFERQEKALETMLAPDVRAAALSKLDALMDKLAHVPQPKSTKDRHIENEYFLKHILTSKQGGHPMTGRRSGRTGKLRRYYGVSKGTSIPIRGSILKKMLQADPIEQAVIAELQKLLAAKDDLRQSVEKIVRGQIAIAPQDNIDVAALKKERAAVAAKLSFVIDELDEASRDAVKEKITQLQRQLHALDDKILAATQGNPADQMDADKIITAIMKQLDDLAKSIQQLPPAALRNVIQLFVAKLEGDLKTKSISMELNLPKWAISDDKAIRTACASTTDLHASQEHRHTATDAVLAQIDCQRQKQGRSYCYDCVRRKAA